MIIDNLKTHIKQFIYGPRSNGIKRHLPNYIKAYLVDLLSKRNSRVSIIRSFLWSQRSDCCIVVCKNTTLLAKKQNIKGLVPRSTLYIGWRNNSPIPHTTIECHENARIYISGGVSVYQGCYIVVHDNGVLTMGNDTYISEGSRIQCRERITIGANCSIAWGVNILDTDEHLLLTNGQVQKTKFTAPVSINDHVWIGCNATILKGVVIGSDSVVAAGAVVTHDVPPHSLVAGNPAKIIRQNISW